MNPITAPNGTVLVINAGSSSIKYQLLDPAQPGPQAVGIVQRIGQDMSTIDHEVGDAEYHEDVRFADHTEAVIATLDKLFYKMSGARGNCKAVIDAKRCLLYTSEAADDIQCVNFGGMRRT